MAFIKDKIKRWNEKNKQVSAIELSKPRVAPISEMVADVLKNKKLYQIKGKVNSAKIMQRFNIGYNKAVSIAQLSNSSE